MAQEPCEVAMVLHGQPELIYPHLAAGTEQHLTQIQTELLVFFTDQLPQYIQTIMAQLGLPQPYLLQLLGKMWYLMEVILLR